jgi:8-oxo-dGTP pyrophosphatase MutT (NUDIX family)
MDVKIRCEEGCFKYRVAGAVVKDDKLLMVNICNNGFYCLPGGHIHLGEDSLTAMKREIGEEVGITCKSLKLISLAENFFDGKHGQMHEVCYVYVIEPNEDIPTEDYDIVENDEGELKPLHFKWCPLSEIDSVDFRPKNLIEKFKNKDFTFEHFIIKD